MNRYNIVKRACEINDLIFNEIITKFNFKSEDEIYRYILKRFRDFKVKKAFDPIVANNNSRIHPKPRNIMLKRGFLVIDLGCKYKGYCSDMTRTVVLGKANKIQKKLYSLVFNCQRKCLKRVKSGAYCSELDYYARGLLGPYKRFFIHSLGHGLSKKIHVSPTLKINSSEKMKKGSFITIEPGIYIKEMKKEVGIRIEDTVYVGKKVEVLSQSPKRLMEIKNHN